MIYCSNVHTSRRRDHVSKLKYGSVRQRSGKRDRNSRAVGSVPAGPRAAELLAVGRITAVRSTAQTGVGGGSIPLHSTLSPAYENSLSDQSTPRLSYPSKPRRNRAVVTATGRGRRRAARSYRDGHGVSAVGTPTIAQSGERIVPEYRRVRLERPSRPLRGTTGRRPTVGVWLPNRFRIGDPDEEM